MSKGGGIGIEDLAPVFEDDVLPKDQAPPLPPDMNQKENEVVQAVETLPGKHPNMVSPGFSTMYEKGEFIQKLYGLKPEQMARAKALVLMGLDEEDLYIAQKLLNFTDGGKILLEHSKEEKLLGYTSGQRSQLKALGKLGITEDTFIEERQKVLDKMGIGIDNAVFKSLGPDPSTEKSNKHSRSRSVGKFGGGKLKETQLQQRIKELEGEVSKLKEVIKKCVCRTPTMPGGGQASGTPITPVTAASSNSATVAGASV
ncbi:unnamed protein product [Chrysoparadoxa australica]